MSELASDKGVGLKLLAVLLVGWVLLLVAVAGIPTETTVVVIESVDGNPDGFTPSYSYDELQPNERAVVQSTIADGELRLEEPAKDTLMYQERGERITVVQDDRQYTFDISTEARGYRIATLVLMTFVTLMSLVYWRKTGNTLSSLFFMLTAIGIPLLVYKYVLVG